MSRTPAVAHPLAPHSAWSCCMSTGFILEAHRHNSPKHQAYLVLVPNLVHNSHDFTANVYKALLEVFPPADLGYLHLHPVSPVRSNSKQTYKTRVNLVLSSNRQSLERWCYTLPVGSACKRWQQLAKACVVICTSLLFRLCLTAFW